MNRSRNFNKPERSKYVSVGIVGIFVVQIIVFLGLFGYFLSLEDTRYLSVSCPNVEVMVDVSDDSNCDVDSVFKGLGYVEDLVGLDGDLVEYMKFSESVVKSIQGSRWNDRGAVSKKHLSEECSELLRNMDKNEMLFSEQFQDYVLYRNFFLYTENGFYVEVGEIRPSHQSVTKFFDVCLGWKGLCIVHDNAVVPEDRTCKVVKGGVVNVNNILKQEGVSKVHLASLKIDKSFNELQQAIYNFDFRGFGTEVVEFYAVRDYYGTTDLHKALDYQERRNYMHAFMLSKVSRIHVMGPGYPMWDKFVIMRWFAQSFNPDAVYGD